ncbi:MAG: cytochrome b/b6 domain-containing protein [Burkholderiales bacterium]
MEKSRILVWDLPVRVFHWVLAASFAGAFLTAESERVRDVHVALGYTFAGLLAFRVLWGVIGSRHARFASFVRGPGAVLRYLRSLLSSRPEHHVGHNPAGGWAIVAMLLLGLAVAASGYANHAGWGGDWLAELHEGAASAMLALVIVHVAAVFVSSFLHRENLVGAMITGRRQGRPEDGIRGVRWAPAAAVVAAVTGLWVAQGPADPLHPSSAQAPAHAPKHGDTHDDDDG